MRARWLGAAALVAALSMGCLLGATAALPPSRDARAPSAAASYQTPIVYAETNRGLKPSRLQAYGRTHYFQVGAGGVQPDFTSWNMLAPLPFASLSQHPSTSCPLLQLAEKPIGTLVGNLGSP